MTKATQKVLPPETKGGTDLITTLGLTPLAVIADEEGRDKLLAHISAELKAHQPDLTTAKGRDAVKALAFKVTRTKTAIDEAGKAANANLRAQIDEVDQVRRHLRTTLDAMAVEARKPLTDWEQAEEARIAECQEKIDQLRAMGVVLADDTSATVIARGKGAFDMALDEARFGPVLFPLAVQTKESTVAALMAARDRLRQSEADAAELERLRKEAADREAKDAEEKAARKKKEAEDQAEADRIAREKKIADDAAAQAKADAERAQKAAIDEANEKVAAAERAKEQAERDAADAKRKAEEEAKAIANAEREKERVREADRAHRGRIHSAALASLMTACGLEEDVAKTIITAIATGQITNVKMEY